MQSRPETMIPAHETRGRSLNPLEILEAGSAAALAAGLAAGGYAYAAMWPASRIFGRALTAPRNPATGPPGEIALTFDDGPNPRWTPQLLETLARHQVRATFFLIGKYVVSQRPLVRQMHEAGHLIGNHTWTHPNLAITGSQRTREELARTAAELEQILGAPVRYFRPPFGGRRPATLHIARELGMQPVLWNAITTDWTATAPEQITPRMIGLVERHRSQGYATNIVLHDGGHLSLDVNRSASVAAAGQLIERFSPTHRFVTLDEWKPDL
jgi:peptidoglycan/xylan/chitin deacetylase (PgdA/CDA1 family)